MTGLAAAARRWRSHLGIVWLAVVVVVFSIVVSLMAISEPDQTLSSGPLACEQLDASGHPLAPPRQVALPYWPRLTPGRAQTMSCSVDLQIPPERLSDTTVLVLNFGDAMAIDVNGHRVARASLFEMRALRWVALPTLTQVNPSSLQPGLNRLHITVSAVDRPPQLGRVFIGHHAELLPYYQPRWFVAAILPTLLCGAEIALAMVFALIWAGRRHETAYGWLAVFLFGGGLHGSVLIPDFGLSRWFDNFWNTTVLWETLVCLLFIRAVAGLPSRRRDWLFAVPPALVTIGTLVMPPATVSGPVLGCGAVTVVVMLGICIWWLGWAAARGNRDALILLIGIVGMVSFIVRDIMMIFGFLPQSAYIGRIGLTAFMITVSTLMTLRFTRAMREVDRTADVLRERVDAAEAELRETYEELRVRREAEAIERERSRLMRDLHDGIGGELASMLALADSPKPRSAEIASHARAALSDMRLIISSLEDYGGDLALALGAWRERAAPQVRAAGLQLDWRVDDLPPIPNLGPAQVLDILRIVQEAVTNVIKHAEASTIVLEARADTDSLTISVRDDGAGTAAETRGHGMRNMRERAARLAATLDIRRTGEGTEVLLRIPRAAGQPG